MHTLHLTYNYMCVSDSATHDRLLYIGRPRGRANCR